MYGLSLVNAILYHMTKILGNKTIFRSKKAVIISMTIQIVYPMPAWIFHLCLTSSKSDIITYAQIHMQQAAQYIESHACSFLILSSPVYVYFAISLFLVFLCSTTVFVCCVIAVLLLMRNKSAKLSKDYRLFKEMTIGLISQLVFPLLTALLPMIWMAYEILRTSGNPAGKTLQIWPNYCINFQKLLLWHFKSFLHILSSIFWPWQSLPNLFVEDYKLVQSQIVKLTFIDKQKYMFQLR